MYVIFIKNYKNWQIIKICHWNWDKKIEFQKKKKNRYEKY